MHAERIYTFINDRDGRVLLQALDTPQSEWDSPLAAFKSALEGERALSEKIYAVVDAALAERDHATHTFLQWFISEQVEEEAITYQIAEQLNRIGDNNNGLFLLDQELMGRSPDKRPAQE